MDLLPATGVLVVVSSFTRLVSSSSLDSVSRSNKDFASTHRLSVTPTPHVKLALSSE